MKRGLILVAGVSLVACNPFPSFDGFVAGSCPSDAIFCDDFERDVVQGAWSSETISGGGALSIATGTPTGRALDCHVPAGADGASAALTSTTDASPSRVTMRSLVDVIHEPTQVGIHLNNLTFHDAGGGTSSVFPYFASFGLAIGELRCSSPGSCAYAQSTTFAPLPSESAWHEVAFTVDFGSQPAELTLEVDGATVIDGASLSGALAGTVEIDACEAAVDPSHEDLEVMVDDVVVTGS